MSQTRASIPYVTAFTLQENSNVSPNGSMSKLTILQPTTYAREEYLKGWSNIYLTVTDLMMADIATKPLSEKNKFLKCRAFQLNE